MPTVNPSTRIILLYSAPFFWAAITLFVVNHTSPLQIGPAGILLVFILFYALTASFLFVVAHVANKVWCVISKRKSVSMRRIYYLTSVVAFGPVFMIALNTLGQLGPTEIVLVWVLIILGGFYVSRRTVRSS